MTRFFYPFFLLLCSVGLMVGVVVAQDTETATPAPSKTPIPTEMPTTESEATEAVNPQGANGEESVMSSPLPRAYNQQDLSVLVGNVQRPNGINYFDGYLYAVCNGDWTVYRIEAETGQTITYVQSIRDVHQLEIEATDAGFNIWMPDFETNRLMLVDQSAAFPREIVSENLDGPWGITTISETQFLISNARADNLVIVDREGGSAVAVEGLRSPVGLQTHEDAVYVANNGSARRAIEWFPLDEFDIDEDGNVTPVTDITQPLVSGLQNVSNLLVADDNYLYFTYALGARGVVGRVDPMVCRDGGCTNEDVEIVLLTDLPAPLAGLTITPDMRLFVHTIYRPELYWVDLYQ